MCHIMNRIILVRICNEFLQHSADDDRIRIECDSLLLDSEQRIGLHQLQVRISIPYQAISFSLRRRLKTQ